MNPEEFPGGREARFSARELLMRYYPAALALSLLVGLSASASWSAPATPLDPRAAALQAQGRASLSAGNIDAATDAFEAALAVQPGQVTLVLDLAEAARRQGDERGDGVRLVPGRHDCDGFFVASLLRL